MAASSSASPPNARKQEGRESFLRQRSAALCRCAANVEDGQIGIKLLTKALYIADRRSHIRRSNSDGERRHNGNSFLPERQEVCARSRPPQRIEAPDGHDSRNLVLGRLRASPEANPSSHRARGAEQIPRQRVQTRKP